MLDAWQDDATQLVDPTVDTLMDGAQAVVDLLANLLTYGVSEAPELQRMHGVVACAARVLNEPEPAPLPPSHAEAVLDAALTALSGRLRAAVLAEVNSTREVRAR